MPDFREIAQLAQRIKTNPQMAEQLANQGSDNLEQVLRVAQAPFLSFQPYGSLEKPYTCQVAPALSKGRIRCCIAGNRSGKSYFGLEEDIHDALGIDLITKGPSRRFKPPIEIWVVSDTEEASINIAQRIIVDDILGSDTTGYAWDLVDDAVNYRTTNGFTNNSLVFTNGSRIDFKFSSQGRGSFQGTKKHKIHLDEEQPLDVYKECYARTIDHEGQLLITMTPIFDRNKGMSWMYDELYVQREDKGIEFFNWSIYDNPYLTDAAKEDLMAQYDEDELDARAHGMFTPIGVRLAFKRDIIRRERANLIMKHMKTGRLHLFNDKPYFRPVA